MDDVIQAKLAVLGNEVRDAAIPDQCKQTTLWCLKQLPALYAKFGLTNESRYSEEITRLVQGLVVELNGKASGADGQKLATTIPDSLRSLHEEFGLPELTLKAPRVTATRSRKTG
ncbi:MAG: hypothetical protein JNM56_39275 [Planctomycetia bacterium]|nr:hypothetical protein [Planctomycetia bacterium]